MGDETDPEAKVLEHANEYRNGESHFKWESGETQRSLSEGDRLGCGAPAEMGALADVIAMRHVGHSKTGSRVAAGRREVGVGPVRAPDGWSFVRRLQSGCHRYEPGRVSRTPR